MSDPLPSSAPIVVTPEPTVNPGSGSRWLGAGLCALSAAGYSGLPILGKMAFAAGFSIAGVLGVRFGGAAVLILGYLLLRRQRPFYPGGRAGLSLLGLGLMYGVQASLYFAGLQRIPASMTSVLLYIYPAFVTLLAWRVQRMRPRWVELGAVALGLAGVIMTVRPWSAGAPDRAGLDPLGAALVVASASCYAAYVLLSGVVVRRTGPLIGTGWITVGAAGFFLVFGTATHSLVAPLSALGGWILLGMVLFNTILPLMAFLAGLVRVGPTPASLISTLEPVFTVLLAAGILHERPAGLDILGGLMVLSAAVLVNLTPVRLRPTPREASIRPAIGDDM